jgi:hypothetical protein
MSHGIRHSERGWRFEEAQPKTANSTIELFDEFGRSPWAVLSDKIQDAQEVFLGGR